MWIFPSLVGVCFLVVNFESTFCGGNFFSIVTEGVGGGLKAEDEENQRIATELGNLTAQNPHFGADHVVVLACGCDQEVNDLTESVLREFFNNGKTVMLVSRPLTSHSMKLFWKGSMNIFVLKNLEKTKFIPYIKMRRTFPFWRLSAPTIVLLSPKQSPELSKLTDIFEFLFEFKMFSVAILFKNQDGVFQMVNFDPFTKTLTKLNRNPKFSEVFNDKFKDMHGHPINVTFMNDPPRMYANAEGQIAGVDGHQFRLIFSLMNATYNVIYLNISNERDPYLALFQNLEFGPAEVSLSLRLYVSRNYLNASMDYISPQMLGSLVLLVPAAPALPFFMNLIDPFRLDTWLAVIFLFIVVAAVLHLVRSPSSPSTAIFDTFRLQLGVPLPAMPRAPLERLLVAGFVIYALILLAGYTTEMVSLLAQPRLSADISLDQVNGSGVRIIVPARYRISRHLLSYYLAGVVTNQIEVAENVSIWRLKGEPLDARVAYAALASDTALFVRSDANYANGRRLFHAVPDGLLYSVVSYYVERDCVFEGKLSELVARIWEAGLRKRFRQMALFEAKQERVILEENGMDDEETSDEVEEGEERSVRPFTLEDFRSAFGLLGFGLALACVVFAWEIASFRIKRHVKRKIEMKKVPNYPSEWFLP